MKKTIFTFLVIAFCATGFAKEADKTYENKSIAHDLFIEKIDDGQLVRVRIRVDCDGDGTWDWSYSGVMDRDHIQTYVNQLVAAC